MTYKNAYDAVHMYMSEITSRLIAKTGIPTDRHHLGKLILQSFQDDLNFVAQIDGATDQSETTGSVLHRSIKCAIALKNLGFKKDDVMVLIAPNTVDLCVPLYAALYLGIAIAGTDMFLGVNELKDNFNVLKPNIIFCQSGKTADIEKALELAGLQSKVVTLDAGSNHITLSQLLKDIDDELVKGFQCKDFDPAETTALLTATSGTTGLPKAAMLTHKNMCIACPYIWLMCSKFPTPTKSVLIMSPIQWLSATMNYLFAPILRITRVQSSNPVITPELFARIVNKYKPTTIIGSPLLLRSMLTARDKCDFTCFEFILLGGSLVTQELIDEVKVLAKTNHVYSVYGMSEMSGVGLHHDYPPPKGSSGTPRGALEYRLVDQYTHEDITEANVSGELWVRGPTVFKGYYNNPELTALTLTEDGWLKSGDIFYRDEYWHFYFVERLKSLLKYKSHHVAPAEVEGVIKQHPGVSDVCVVGIPDSDCGDLVVACVVPKPGTTPTAQEIKDIVKESLTDSKQLRGGVIFVKELPLTSTSKVNRKKVQDIALTIKENEEKVK